MRNILFISSICIFLFYSCAKEECEGTNSVAFTFKDGTTGKGLANKNIDVNLVTFRGDGGIKERNTIGHVKTNDTGYFYLEYPCQNESWEVIELDAEDYSIRYMGIKGFPYEEHLKKIIYKSSLGTLKVYLQPKTQWKDGDTLYVGYTNIDKPQELNIDTFYNEQIGLYKIFRTKVWGPEIVYGRGINNFKKGYISDGGNHRIKAKMTGDPVIDSVVINY